MKEFGKNPKEFDKEIEDKLNEHKEESEEDDQPEEESYLVNGQEIKLSPDERKEYVQKGIDYTQKTQALAKERLQIQDKLESLEKDHKAFEVEKQEFFKKNQEELGIKKRFDFVMDFMKQKKLE